VALLLDSLREAGAHDQVGALLARNPAAHAPLDDPYRAVGLLDSLHKAGAHDQAAALAARLVTYVPLADPGRVASLLRSLRETGAREQVAALLARDPAAHAVLGHWSDTTDLLDSLRQAGAHDQAAALTRRLPAAGMFWHFLRQNNPADQFRFGRQADGTPAAPWGWEDLDLWLVLVREDKLHRRSADWAAHVGRYAGPAVPPMAVSVETEEMN
jgi:hypothetical protein